MTLERDVERYLVRRVKAIGGEVRKVQWIGRRGAPDRLVLLPHNAVEDPEDPFGNTLFACAVWVELKRPKGKPATRQQIKEHLMLQGYGQAVYVCHTTAAVDSMLHRYGR